MTVLLVKCHFESAPLNLCFTTTLGTDPSQPATPTNLTTILLNVLVPACAVLVLLIVIAVIAIIYVRKRRRVRRSMLVESMDRVEMKATNPHTEAGLVMVDKYIKTIL